MKTVKMESPKLPAQRGSRRWLIRIALLLGVPFLLYYGYCWGIWGRNSLLLQYLFQCNCPFASEESRYPANVDVIIPACRNVNVGTRLSPSGHFLYVHEEQAGLTSTYLLDLQTMERIDVTNQPFPNFLTDDLWFVESGLEYYIIDRITGAQYPIQKFVYSRPSAEINGDTNLTLLAESLRQAKDIFLIGNSKDTVVALTSDFRTYPERNFIADRFDIPGFDTNRMERFLRENNITYQAILADFPGEAVSPDGRFIARHDGIYLVETNRKIVEGISSVGVRGWSNDGSEVIYAPYLGPCLIRIGFPFADDTACFRRVPQPVLKLRVPEDYLLPEPAP